MLYAVISDIHGNLEALNVVLADIQSYGCDATLCLGDIVGYGADPNECVRLVFEQCQPLGETGVPIVKGNHDEAVTSGDARGFNTTAAFAAQWSRKVLEPVNFDLIENLPLTIAFDDVLLVHSSPYQPSRWYYVTSTSGASEAIDRYPEETKICFIGHSHCPFVMSRDGSRSMSRASSSLVGLQAERQYLVNVGSVGQPRDADPRASYALYDSSRKTIEIRRLQYDISGAQQKITDAGLPESLASRLALGR